MLYDGKCLNWYSHGAFKATSGDLKHQKASAQSMPEEGPIPEGLYSFEAKLAKHATVIGPSGKLDRREGVEIVPHRLAYGGQVWENIAWGLGDVAVRLHWIVSRPHHVPPASLHGWRAACDGREVARATPRLQRSSVAARDPPREHSAR
jgi:hypothetical protein